MQRYKIATSSFDEPALDLRELCASLKRFEAFSGITDAQKLEKMERRN
jgi:hypothetical protein